MITVRNPETIYQASGQIKNGTFHERHFSFDRQKKVEKVDRTNKFLPIVSNSHPGALRIVLDAVVYSCFLEKGKKADYRLQAGRGAYFYVLDGGSVEVNGIRIPKLGAAKIKEETELHFEAKKDAELLLVEVLLA
ncbi:MAG: hypothetical protein ABIH80_04430 [Methanobacteriota archaeon]